MSARDATLLFIREACRLEDVPVTFYRLHKVRSHLLCLSVIKTNGFKSNFAVQTVVIYVTKIHEDISILRLS